jgi:hypothetical protein
MVDSLVSIGRVKDHKVSSRIGLSGDNSRIQDCQARYAGSVMLDIDARC